MVFPFGQNRRDVLLFNSRKSRGGHCDEFVFDLCVLDHIRWLGLGLEVRVVAQLAKSERAGDGDELAQGKVGAVHVDRLVVFTRSADVFDLHDEETGPVSQPRFDQAFTGRKNTVMVTVNEVVPVVGAAFTSTSTVSFVVSVNGSAVTAEARATPPVWPIVDAAMK